MAGTPWPGAFPRDGPKPAFDPTAYEHCPDFDERHTLVNGRTAAVPYAPGAKGYNCNPTWSFSQKH